MSYKMQQVLRTAKQVRAESGNKIPSGTRVVVMSMSGEDSVKVKTADPSQPDLTERAVAPVSAFETTKRGRPRKNG